MTLKDVVKPELVAIPAVISRGTYIEYELHIIPAAHTLRFLLLPCRAEHVEDTVAHTIAEAGLER